LLFFKFKY